MRAFGIVGWKNCGKTGLVERLVIEITGRGLSVSTLKHAHHAFEVDQPGRDSFRHRQAGASQVLVAGARRWALMTELRGADEPDLAAHLARLSPVDLVLIEGWKRAPHAKIAAWRAASGREVYLDESVRAVAADAPLEVDRPVMDLNDTRAIADFILAETGL